MLSSRRGRGAAAVLALIAGAALGAGWPAEATAKQRQQGFFEQLRMPWQNERRPARRVKRTGKPDARPATRQAEPGGRRRPGAKVAAPLPSPEALPDIDTPPTLMPIARGAEIVAAWRAVAEQVPAPLDPPLISSDGPAPAPANVLALIDRTPAQPEPATPPRRPDPPRDDVPPPPSADAQIPLPPERPDDDAPEASVDQNVPLPPRRPGEQTAVLVPPQQLPPAKPELTAPDIDLPNLAREDDPDCQALEREGVAVFKAADPIEGPGVCGAPAPVELTGVKREDGAVVTVKPAATLRCAMAREFADYVRKDLAPAAEHQDVKLARVEIAGSFMCRGRNGAAGGKMSEHGRANAVDVAGLALSDGRSFMIFAKEMPQALSDRAKSAACERFSTVLGPGSDGHHETHLHLDLQPRRSKTKLCEWDEPAVASTPDDGDRDHAEKKADDDKQQDEPQKTAAKRRPAQTQGKADQTP